MIENITYLAFTLSSLREYTRSESERSFDEVQMRKARLQSLSRAYLSPQNKSLAQSFRYMRNKPTIIAFKTPSLESCEQRPSQNSIGSMSKRLRTYNFRWIHNTNFDINNIQINFKLLHLECTQLRKPKKEWSSRSLLMVKQIITCICINFIKVFVNFIDHTQDNTAKSQRPVNYPVGKPLEVFLIPTWFSHFIIYITNICLILTHIKSHAIINLKSTSSSSSTNHHHPYCPG